MRVTLRDIAKKAGVSHSTVVMALRNDPSISVQRRRQIRHMAKDLGYKPDPFLSGLAVHSRTRVPAKERGVLAWVNHWANPKLLRQFREFDAYWKGASDAAKRFGYRLDEVRWGMDCSAERYEQILLARGIQGVLIPPHNDLLDWRDFDWKKFSVLRFGMSVQNPDSNQVTSDIFRAVVMAVQKIRDYGYRRIGLTVNEEFNQRLGGNFVSGYFYSQSRLNLKTTLPPLLTHLKAKDNDNVDQERERLKIWIEEHRPDAILTADVVVPGLLRELGFRIGKDIAVAGTSVLDIPVDAGIDQRSEAVGRVAVEMLVKQINIGERGEPSAPCRIMVESRWRDGSSLPPRC
jgi:LacI family transcriptional regulator